MVDVKSETAEAKETTVVHPPSVVQTRTVEKVVVQPMAIVTHEINHAKMATRTQTHSATVTPRSLRNKKAAHSKKVVNRTSNKSERE